MIIKKACIDHCLAHECPKSQIFAWRSENKETVIMDKLLTHPLTLHGTLSISRLLWPVPPCTPSITGWLPASSSLWPGNSPVPLLTAPSESFQAFLQSVHHAWLGFTRNKRNPFHSQFQIPPFKLPSAPVTMEHLMLSMFMAPSCRREHLADLWRGEMWVWKTAEDGDHLPLQCPPPALGLTQSVCHSWKKPLGQKEVHPCSNRGAHTAFSCNSWWLALFWGAAKNNSGFSCFRHYLN